MHAMMSDRKWKRVGGTMLTMTVFGGTLGGFGVSPADAAIRVMTYNVDADTDRNGDGSINTADGSYNSANVAQVVRAVANYALAGNAQSPDVISLQELNYVPAVSLSAIVSSLNSTFGAGTYAYDTTVTGKSTGNSVGNGQNGLIYKTSTINVTGAALIGTPSGTGESRTPVRYQLQATGYTGANTFYLYDEHTKASAGADEANRRSIETAAVRADADTIAANNANAHIIYTGDFNLAGTTSSPSNISGIASGGSNEQSYKNLTAAGTGAQAFDPLVGSFQNYTTAQTKYYTEADDSLSRRYDLQLITGNSLTGSTAAGLHLLGNTYTNFGGNYYTADGTLATGVAFQGSVATTANALATGISLADLQNLIDTTDHLPVIADYTIAVPEPGTLAVVCVVGLVGLRRRRA